MRQPHFRHHKTRYLNRNFANQPRAIGEELRDRSVATVAQHRPGNEPEQQSRSARARQHHATIALGQMAFKRFAIARLRDLVIAEVKIIETFSAPF